MASFQEAVKKGSEMLAKVIEEHSKDIEEGWTNTEDEKGFNVGLRLKFNPKDGGDIKVEAAISYAAELDDLYDEITGEKKKSWAQNNNKTLTTT